MKNFKKLFIALPLVLVMLLAAVPVSAAQLDTYKVEANTLGLNLKLDETVVGKSFEAKTSMVPIWGAVKTYQADKDKVDKPSQGAGWFKLLNDGLPMGWLEASSLVSTDFMIGKSAVETLPVFAEYVLPTFQINHVERIETNVKVPETWTGKKLDNAYFVKENTTEVIKADKAYTEAEVAEINGLELKDGKATYRGQETTYVYTREVPADAKAITVDAADYAFTAAPADGSKEATVELEKEINGVAAGTYTLTELRAKGFTVEGAETVKITYKEATLVIKFAKSLYEFPAGRDITAEIETVSTNPVNNVTTAIIKNTKAEVVVTIGKATEQFVDATLWGLLVIVEEKYVPVTINHHFIVEGSEEIIQTSTGKQEKGVALTANNIKAEWLMEVGEFKYDPTKTEITEKTNTNQLVIGETIVESYVVDLFYTAGEGSEDEIDAAFAEPTTAVAGNSNVANLPATGAASNFALILSSAALVVVGLFIKK